MCVLLDSFQLLVLIVRVACSINSWCLINIATQLLLCIFDFSNEISPYIYIYIFNIEQILYISCN